MIDFIRSHYRHIIVLQVLITSIAAALGLRVENPRIEGFHPLDEENYAFSPLVQSNAAMLKLNTKIFIDSADVNFEKRQITFSRRDLLGYTLWEHHYGELSDYLSYRRNFVLYRGWYKGITDVRKESSLKGPQVLKLQWELPVQYPSWAQRVLGNDPPRLSIDGSLKLKMGFDNSTYIESQVDDDPTSTTGFNFDVEYQFGIVGSVGRLININIRADSESDISFNENLKNFKIEYKESKPGELEDEIIQEVVAGYTGFSMPGQGLAGYSESHEGLFGIKVKSKLGPLTLTTIASHEQGESAKLSVSNSRGETDIPYRENQYLENRYFFLHNIYRKHYNRKYGKGGASKVPEPPKVTELQVWRTVDDAKASIIKGESNRSVEYATIDTIEQLYQFELLVPERHYKLNSEEGHIKFFDSISIQRNDIIAIYLRTSDNQNISRGGSKQDTVRNLWTLKPRIAIDSAQVDTSRYYLMWRNVYDLPRLNDYSQFTLDVMLNRQDGQKDEVANKKSMYYSDILGLTENDGKVLISRGDIFDKEQNVIIIPPYDTTFFGNEPFNNPLLGEFRDSTIYKYSPERRPVDYTPFYTMSMSGSSKQTEFTLGWGVMPGTERVVADGKLLERDRDYLINYDMGSLELTSPSAKAAEKVEIEYQREALFVPDRKVFLGMHGEVKLPFLSDKSFAGVSLLFQKTTVTEDVPRLDQEPYRKSLLVFNTRIDLEPEWMTTLTNKIPLIKSEATSSAVFDFELAHSRMNPNTDDQAYVDDFEESKQPFPLGGSHESWYQASPPYGADSLHLYPPAWENYWFTPRLQDERHRVPRSQIWANTTIGAGDDYETVLRLHVRPAPDSTELAPRFKKAWAGMMTPISTSFADKQKDRYFEFLMKAVDDFTGKGKLIIQMGDMREDLLFNGGPPNQLEDREDTNSIWTDLVDSKKDLGLDRKNDKDEFYLIPGELGGWDTLFYDSLNFTDPGRDNYKKYVDNLDNYKYVNRTQGDGQLTSEDINFDGTVQTHTNEDYFQFTIDISDTTAPFIEKTTVDSGWRKYRIPLKEVIAGYEGMRDTVNGPSWTKITMVRIIWTNFDSTDLTKEKQLIFSDMQFVGNQWEPVYDSVGTKIEATSINNNENSEYEKSTNGDRFYWRRQNSQQGAEWERESALKLNFQNIEEGEEALVTRNFEYQALNLSAYRKLSIMVYGVDSGTTVSPDGLLYDGKVDFVFRFGTDDSTYYEYRTDIYSGWNEVEIDLRAISKLKNEFMIQNPDSAIIIDPRTHGKGTLRVKAPRGREPNFSRIQWIGMGVAREENSGGGDLYSSGELWVNELKVTGVGKLNGWAMRTGLRTKWAELLDFSTGLDYEDGDFRRMTESTITPDNSSLAANLSSTLWLNRFLPGDWGVSLPVGVSLNGSISRPQLKNNTDVYLTDEKSGRSDNFLDMISDAADMVLRREKDSSDMTSSEHYENQNVTKTVFANYSKSAESDNPLVNLTADRITVDVKYNQNVKEARQGPLSVEGNRDHIISDTLDTYTGKLKYDLTPSTHPKWTRWKPLAGSKQDWVPRYFKDYEFSLLPKRLVFDLADVNYGSQHWTDNKLNIDKNNNTFDLRHGLSLDYSPIAPLIDMTYTLGIARDMHKDAGREFWDMTGNVFNLHSDSIWNKRYITHGEKSRSQTSNVRFNPQIFDWLSSTAEYSSDYRADIAKWRTDSADYINAGVKSTLSLKSDLNLGVLFKGFADATAKTKAGEIFSSIDKGFTNVGLRSLSYTYSVSSELRNNYLGSDLIGKSGKLDFLRYQFGLSGIDEKRIWSGDMNDEMLGGMRYRIAMGDKIDLYRDDRRTVYRKHALSTGFNLKMPFEITFSPISLGWSKSFEVHPDTNYIDTSVSFPELSISSRTPALMKIGFINDMVRNLNLSSNFSFRRSYRNSGILGVDTTDKFDFSPLLSFTGSVKMWPINFNYNTNRSKEVTFTLKDTGRVELRKTLFSAHDFNITYSIEQSSRLSEIRLLTWVIPVKGRTTLGIKGSYSDRKEYILEAESVDELNFSLTPHLTYIFTDNVTGTAEYTYGKRKKYGEKETIDNKFNLIVEIRF